MEVKSQQVSAVILEVEADDGVGSRPFQTPQKIVRYLRVLDLSQCVAESGFDIRNRISIDDGKFLGGKN